MDFFSHCKFDENNNIIEAKHLWRHLNNAADMCTNKFSTNTKFSFSNNTLVNFAKYVGLLHDLGKYTNYFQEYLTKHADHGELKNHSHIGAYAAYHYFFQQNQQLALFAYFIIKSHHKNLDSFDTDILFDKHAAILLEKHFTPQKNNLLKSIDYIESELKISNITELLNIPDEPLFCYKKNIEKKPSIENYFFINYLFSLLIEADKLDASNTTTFKVQPCKKDAVDNLINTFPVSHSLMNNIRNEIRNQIKNKLNESLLSNNIFTLTSPTGSGKTLLSLEFATYLKNLIFTKENKNVQIIYSLPFINIIEQTINVMGDVFNTDNEILGHYQNTSYFDIIKTEESGVDYNKRLQMLETWQADIIVTSFVQLLETLIGNKNKYLKKFHHLADSIVILDEVQAIKTDFMPLIGAVLYYCSKFLNTKFLLMTATKPIIFELAEKLLIKNNKIETVELLDNHNTYFNQINRTKIIPMLNNAIDINLFEELFNELYTPDKSCLIVCNKISTSIDIYNQLQQRVKETGNHIYYLSTNILPIVKEKILRCIKAELLSNRKPVLVSTQVIEAGVDLDFDMGFRDIAPIDSIIQAVGRINRNNKHEEPASFYIIDFCDCVNVYDLLSYNVSKMLLSKHEVIFEKDYLDLIDSYNTELANKLSYKKSKEFFKSLETLNYSRPDDNTCISKFHVIDEKAFTASVFLERNDIDNWLYKQFCNYIDKKISKDEFNKNKKEFSKRILEIPKIYLSNELQGKVKDLYYINKDIINYYYSNQTGFIRKNETNIFI